MKLIKYGLVALIMMCAVTITAQAAPYIIGGDSFTEPSLLIDLGNGGWTADSQNTELGFLVRNPGNANNFNFSAGSDYTKLGIPDSSGAYPYYDFSLVTSVWFMMKGDFTGVTNLRLHFYYPDPLRDVYYSDFVTPNGIIEDTSFTVTSSQFNFASLTKVSQVSIEWDGDTSGNQAGIDLLSFNVEGGTVPPVPEPETVWMMLAVLASLGVTFRRQLMDLTGRFVKT